MGQGVKLAVRMWAVHGGDGEGARPEGVVVS